MLTINPREIKTMELHSYMLSAIAPRPIAFASTIDEQGNCNLSPFSFFNAFGSNPPMLIFSPARRVRDNTIKHTLENVYQTKEVVINVVNYAMVHQQSLASTEYPRGVDEFIKAGFTKVKSELVKPFRVKESPVQMECKVQQVIETGQEGGAGNLILCEILLMHINEEILDADKKIDQHKIDLVARLGADWYCRASGKALFQVAKPLARVHGLGIDALPQLIKNSHFLSGNHLGQLANSETIPSQEEIDGFKSSEKFAKLSHLLINEESYFIVAKNLLEKDEVRNAFCLLMMKA